MHKDKVQPALLMLCLVGDTYARTTGQVLRLVHTRITEGLPMPL